MEEVVMVPTREFERLQDFYKGQITQSALLNKAGRLATEKHLIFKNRKIPPATAVKMVQPLAREQLRLTKRIRTGGAPASTGVGAPDDDEAMVDSPLENLLKKIIKKETPPRKPPIPPKPVIKKESTTVKKEPKPSTSKKTTLSESSKTFLRRIGVDERFIEDDDDEGGYSPKVAKGKQPLKAKKTATQKLQEGWEEWDNPTKKKLEYEDKKRKGKKK